MNIVDVLTEQAATNGGRAALIDRRDGRTRTTTYAELHDCVRRKAALLNASGLRPGDAVLVFQPMSLELYVTLLGVFAGGMTAMFLDPSAGRDHIERCCALGNPQGFVASRKAHLLRLRSPALQRIPRKFAIGRHWWNEVMRSQPTGLAVSEEDCPDSDAPALLTFTSGSTGEPKAAVRTHKFLMAQHRALEQALKLTAGTIDLTTLPIFVLANLGSGLTSVMPDADLRAVGRIDPFPVIAQITSHNPATTGGSPAFLERIADRCLRTGQTLPSFRTIFAGGAPVFPRLLDKLHKIAPSAEIIAVYGSTEAEPIAHIPLSEITEADRSRMRAGGGLLAGVPVGTILMRVVSDRWGEPIGPYTDVDFASLSCDVNEPGEIVVSGEHVLRGYLHGRGDEETKFRVGDARVVWHRTGDAGYLDESGRIWLLGRCSAKIADDRGILYPFSVETAIHDIDGLARSAVVALNGNRLVVLELKHRSNIDAARLKDQLAWAYIDEVRTVEHIPVDKRHNAKIDYPALMRILGDGRRQHGR